MRLFVIRALFQHDNPTQIASTCLHLPCLGLPRLASSVCLCCGCSKVEFIDQCVAFWAALVTCRKWKGSGNIIPDTIRNSHNLQSTIASCSRCFAASIVAGARVHVLCGQWTWLEPVASPSPVQPYAHATCSSYSYSSSCSPRSTWQQWKGSLTDHSPTRTVLWGCV